MSNPAVSPIRLNLGAQLSGDGNVYEAVYDLREMIPDSHEFFIDFLSADLSGIREMIRLAVEKESSEHVLSADGLLQKVHPYFRLSCNRAAYINRELARTIWSASVDIGIFDSLMIKEGVWETSYDYWIDENDGKGTLSSLIDLQENLRRITFLLLDESNPSVTRIPFPIRAGLCGLICSNLKSPGEEPALSVPGSVSVLPYPKSMSVLRSWIDFSDSQLDMLTQIFHEVDALAFNSTAETPVISHLAEAVTDVNDLTAYTVYNTPFLEDLFSLEVHLMLVNHTRIRKCLDCGSYFAVVPSVETDLSDIDPDFCKRASASGDSCFARAVKRKRLQLVNSIYKKAYKAMYARLLNNKISKADLDLWRKNASILNEKAVSGQISAEELRSQLYE